MITKIKQQQGKKVVSAKEMFLDLGYGGEGLKFSVWIENNLFKYPDKFIENETYVKTYDGDYALELKLAKFIAAKDDSPKGNKLLDVLIDAEEMLMKMQTPAQYGSLEMIRDMAINLIETNDQVKQHEIMITELQVKTTTRPDYYTVAAWLKKEGLKCGVEKAKRLGKISRDICISNGWEIEKVNDTRWGKVGCYPEEAIKQAWQKINL